MGAAGAEAEPAGSTRDDGGAVGDAGHGTAVEAEVAAEEVVAVGAAAEEATDTEVAKERNGLNEGPVVHGRGRGRRRRDGARGVSPKGKSTR